MLDRLPLSLQQCVLLEWLSPEAVFRAASAIDAVRTCVVESPRAFRAAEEEVLSDACVLWFRRHLPKSGLVLWSSKIEQVDGMRGSSLSWYLNGMCHRDDDLPAVVWSNGTQEWYLNGLPHREDDKPAVVHWNGSQSWYQNGRLHCDGDLPAILRADGKRTWCQNGRLYRADDKPTVIQADGTQEWGTWYGLHRDGGRPAVVHPDGREEWYQHGIKCPHAGWSPSTEVIVTEMIMRRNSAERVARGLGGWVLSS